MFDYTQHESLGMVETGSHSIYEFEIYKVDGKLIFIDHEHGFFMTYGLVFEFFKSRDDELGFHQQMQPILMSNL